MGQPTHYDTLGLAAPATTAQVRQAYRHLARATHPDLGGDAARFAQVQLAHDVLRDPNSRAAYDAQLRRESRQTEREADRQRAERARKAEQAVVDAKAALSLAKARQALEGAAAYYPHGVPGNDGRQATYSQRLHSELSALHALHPGLRTSAAQALRPALAENRRRARERSAPERRALPAQEVGALLALLVAGTAARASAVLSSVVESLGAPVPAAPELAVTVLATAVLGAVLMGLAWVRTAAGPWSPAELRAVWVMAALAVGSWEPLGQVQAAHPALLGSLALYGAWVALLRALPRPLTPRAWRGGRAWARELVEELVLRPRLVRRWVRTWR